ncbi:Arogenate dehydrogenase 1 [Hibiscus syriacus]|uniref:Arogenate dehydrogenase 1 n=1 Tax=Hibiscus syriacus TaxID=106335 RepID=A0A6A2ZAM5_HIBSY|nr:Arogenate dehydrogenase 1 [Hibiscus syriacus]
MIYDPSLHRSLPKHSLSLLSSPSPPLLQSLSFLPKTSTKPIFVHSAKPLCIKCCFTTPASEPDPCDTRPVSSLKIAIIGFGNYGQFLAKTLVSQGHKVLAHSRSDYSHIAKKMGVFFLKNPDDLCEQHPEVILLCTSIISTELVLKTLPLQRLKRSTLFIDVLSVKEFARNLLLDVLPADFDIICSHPMFGPQSARQSWRDLLFVYEKVRIGNESSRVQRCEQFLEIFRNEGCKMVEMSCQEHDKFAAGSQFMTHTVGRVLDMLGLESTPINTKGYEALLDLVENTSGDSFDLYYGLFLYNKSALEMVERLDLAFDALRNELFGRLHQIVRKQLFEKGQKVKSLHDGSYQNDAASTLSSNALRSQDIIAYEFKGKISESVDDSSKLKIAIVGFGNFGQFLANTMARQGHSV